MGRLDVAVVIVTYNSGSQVLDLLATIGPSMDGVSHSVTCVDNGSSDDTVDLLTTNLEDMHVLRRPNRGYAAGLNAGFAVATESEAVLVLNADVTLAPGSVRIMLECLRETGAGIVTPRILGRDGVLSLTLRREPTLLRTLGLSWTGCPMFSEHVQERDHYEYRHAVDWATGAVMLVSRAAWERLGGWDESYFLYSEETDFCLRARDEGLPTIYEPRAVTTHLGGGSGRSARTETMQTLNRVRLYARRHCGLASTAYWVLISLSALRDTVVGRAEGRAMLQALLFPARRPEELEAGDHLVPR